MGGREGIEERKISVSLSFCKDWIWQLELELRGETQSGNEKGRKDIDGLRSTLKCCSWKFILTIGSLKALVSLFVGLGVGDRSEEQEKRQEAREINITVEIKDSTRLTKEKTTMKD